MPIKLSEILRKAFQYTWNIMLQMPKYTNLTRLVEYIQKSGIPPLFTIEKIISNNNVEQIFIYLGSEPFTKLSTKRLKREIYQEENATTSVEKKRVKDMIRGDLNTLLRRIYKNNCSS